MPYTPKQGFLSGYKTYIVAGLTILAAVAAYAVGEPVPGASEALSLPDLVQLVVTALLGTTLRAAIK
jgi:hypothetical protein